jgi:hypothetical protein
MPTLTPKDVAERYQRAKERRATWENHWQECYDYALPQRDGFISASRPGAKKTDKLFDGTAPDAVDQLAASLLAQLTPPWARWIGFTPGTKTTPEDREILAPELERAAATVQSHFNRSNFAVEMHQCFLDLVTAGTASLMFEETPTGDSSVFRFTAVPLSQVMMEEGASGRLDTTLRRSELSPAMFRARFPKAKLPDSISRRNTADPDSSIAVIEAVAPEKSAYAYMAVLADDENSADPPVLAEGTFATSPFINFRWLKAPGEGYGRSPVMKTLPDIKTANKVVELVLKNASIAVTGIWQADDDGVLNPATIKLAPGTIIPKAVGSKGLTPLEAPGKFDLSQIMLKELRAHIRGALLADKLGQIDSPRMTATEVIERSAEMARILGATYGRLQSELLTPLVTRAVAILVRRGEIPALRLDGHTIDLQYKSPLAQIQAQKDAQNTLTWLNTVKTMGPEASAVVDGAAAARWLGRAFGVPDELIRQTPAPDPAANPLAALVGGKGMPDAEQINDLIAGLGDIKGMPNAEQINDLIDKFGGALGIPSPMPKGVTENAEK